MTPDPAVVLGRTFAYRAEQLKDRVFSLYQEPGYFRDLLTEVPCALVGGRGTGKTTVLRGLSYEGQAHLRPNQPPASWPYYGVYLRIHSARVAAFEGPELSSEEWSRVFGHYINLLLTEATLDFLIWYSAETAPEPEILGARELDAVAQSLGLEPGLIDLRNLADEISKAKRLFEVYINSIADAPAPPVSIAGAPVDVLMQAVMSTDVMRGKLFFFLIDEYENLRATHQRVLNTLIKHCGEFYTFKIGVKQLGWRVKDTLTDNEQLQAPADYALINIDESLQDSSVFTSFGARVCQERLEAVAQELEHSGALPLTELFPKLAEEDEAQRLGIGEHVSRMRSDLLSSHSGSLDAFDELPPLYQYLLGFWADGHGETINEAYADFLARPDHWAERYQNYKHSLLFTIRAGRRGTRKFYAGLDSLMGLAGGNIRFLVQSVEQALRDHLESVGTEWLTRPVDAETQTSATQKVAQSNLVELEGLSLIGPRITRLVVGLGRVFQLMAQHPEGHTPEVNQFRINDLVGDPFRDDAAPELVAVEATSESDPVRGLLAEAITHLALVQLPTTKMAGPSTREYDYMLHPMFAPLFAFSYRKKRKMTISSAELIGLVDDPRRTIGALLQRNNRSDPSPDEVLPEQMGLFDRYLRSV